MANKASTNGIRARLLALDQRIQASPGAQEALNAATLVLLCVVLVALGDVHFWGAEWPRWSHIVPILIAGGAALVRVRNLRVSLLLSAIAITLDALLGGSIALPVILVDALYNSARFGQIRLRRFVTGFVVVATILIAAALSAGDAAAHGGEPHIDGRTFVLSLLQVAAILGGALWWGGNMRQRSEIAALAEQRLELERARAADIERIAVLDRNEAVRAERTRMASDLHDAIASRLSAIAIHSGAALAAPPSSARERAALKLARSSSVAALEDMRAMITVLRSEQQGSSDDASPSPPLEWLNGLTDAARASGSQVRVRGEVPQSLPPSLGQAIYRIVQESLTNAAKHAPQSAVEIVFDFTASSGRVLVRNDLSVPRIGDVHSAVNAGTGLMIMKERAEAFGGTLVAGARGTLWCVQLDVPITNEGRESVLASGELHR